MKNRKKDTRWLVGVAMLAAIIIVMANTPLGFIPLPITKAKVEIDPVMPGERADGRVGFHVTATTGVTGVTGIEMEALTAASVACLTVYDMCKAVDRGMEIVDVRLLRKEGGRSGLWERRV